MAQTQLILPTMATCHSPSAIHPQAYFSKISKFQKSGDRLKSNVQQLIICGMLTLLQPCHLYTHHTSQKVKLLNWQCLSSWKFFASHPEKQQIFSHVLMQSYIYNQPQQQFFYISNSLILNANKNAMSKASQYPNIYILNGRQQCKCLENTNPNLWLHRSVHPTRVQVLYVNKSTQSMLLLILRKIRTNIPKPNKLKQRYSYYKSVQYFLHSVFWALSKLTC